MIWSKSNIEVCVKPKPFVATARTCLLLCDSGSRYTSIVVLCKNTLCLLSAFCLTTCAKLNFGQASRRYHVHSSVTILNTFFSLQSLQNTTDRHKSYRPKTGRQQKILHFSRKLYTVNDYIGYLYKSFLRYT